MRALSTVRVMVAVLAALVLAASPSEVTPLTFAEALSLAERTPGPEGAARAAEVRRAESALLSPFVFNPQITVEPGYRRRPDEQGADLRVGVSQAFGLSGQASARDTAVRAEEAALDAEARAALLSRRLAIAEAWLRLWAAEQAATQSLHEVELADSFRQAVEGASQLGASTKLEVAEASAYLAEAKLAGLDAEGLLAERRVELAKLLGRDPTRQLQAHGPLPEVELPPDAAREPWVARASQLPEAMARVLGARVERARAAEVHASRGTWLQVGLAGLREYDGATGGALTLTLTPSLFERGERDRGTLLATAEKLEGEARDVGHRAAAELALSFHEVQHSREVLDTLRGQLLPAAEEAARLRELLFQSGDSTVPEVVLARRALASARIRLGHARAQETWARVKARLLIDALSGVPTP
ncbi:TolC family protein [Vitiosangium sp. GDMCC 1.1324]|uniref:TolC family protein n=1 Tax=Vitiosangium sp. (strain GDMCC 1.1324) TaxID=2138576 RepID=UPI00130DD454|nr:TolC family protein [Vitiosangium sp. GDMCC 1.1324]